MCQLSTVSKHHAQELGHGCPGGKGDPVGCKVSTIGRKGECGRKGMGFEIRHGFNPRLFTLSGSCNHLVPQSPHLNCEGNDF